MTMGKTKTKDHRSASLTRRQSTREVKQSFLIVCEGVRTEPDYFKAFRMTAATVKAVGQTMNTTSLVSKAISIRDADQKKKRTYDQCWVVFDKDDFPAKDFNEAIALAEKTVSRWPIATRRLNIGSCCTSISTKGRCTGTVMPTCCQGFQEYPIPRRKDSGLLCITDCSTCSRRPLRMPLPFLPMSHMVIRLWKNLPLPYICW